MLWECKTDILKMKKPLNIFLKYQSKTRRNFQNSIGKFYSSNRLKIAKKFEKLSKELFFELFQKLIKASNCSTPFVIKK